jgi:pentose-5-phosphate-3-epimerase
VLMTVTDNGSNMIKAINTCKQLLKKQAEAADATIDGGSGIGTSSNEESVNEIEADGADVIVDTDSHNDVPKSVKKREGMAQLCNEVEGSVSKPNTDSEFNNDNLS